MPFDTGGRRERAGNEQGPRNVPQMRTKYPNSRWQMDNKFILYSEFLEFHETLPSPIPRGNFKINFLPLNHHLPSNVPFSAYIAAYPIIINRRQTDLRVTRGYTFQRNKVTRSYRRTHRDERFVRQLSRAALNFRLLRCERKTRNFFIGVRSPKSRPSILIPTPFPVFIREQARSSIFLIFPIPAASLDPTNFRRH